MFSAGSELKTLYVAREGSFKTVALSEDGQQQVIGFHLPGELMGLDALGSGNLAGLSVPRMAPSVGTAAISARV